MNRFFTQSTFNFLGELEANNNRDWFNSHKQEYEDTVRTPALNFIRAMHHEMPRISTHFLASPRKVGGSLMRVYRDTRFSRDKTPYKTNIGIHFRHARGKDVHAPGLYLHIANEECFLGAGIWRPDSRSLGRIRDRIIEHPDQWQAARGSEPFGSAFPLAGDRLTRAPRGYDKDHALLEDLKYKDFIGCRTLSPAEVLADELLEQTVAGFISARPFVSFLCQALELEF